MSTQYSRIRIRRGTRPQVETASGLQYELFVDTTNGHLWMSDGTSQTKIDPRGIVVHNGNVVTHNDEVVLL